MPILVFLFVKLFNIDMSQVQDLWTIVVITKYATREQQYPLKLSQQYLKEIIYTFILMAYKKIFFNLFQSFNLIRPDQEYTPGEVPL